MQADNDEDRALSVGNEVEARQEIETALQAEVPDFLYLPKGMKFDGYELVESIGLGTLEYSFTDGYLYLNISNSITDMSQGNMKESDGVQAEEIETLSGKLKVVIKNMEENKEQYEARWEYRNVSYTLTGELKKAEMIKIIENISYSM